MLVNRKGNNTLSSLEQLQGHRIAITRYSTLNAMLSRDYPKISWVETESAFYSMALLNSGAVDAVITTLIDANHALASNPELVIRTSVGSEPANFAMATTGPSQALLSILDKALLSISPEDKGTLFSNKLMPITSPEPIQCPRHTLTSDGQPPNKAKKAATATTVRPPHSKHLQKPQACPWSKPSSTRVSVLFEVQTLV